MVQGIGFPDLPARCLQAAGHPRNLKQTTMTTRSALRLMPSVVTVLLALAAVTSQAANVQVKTKVVADANISQHVNLGGGTVPLGNDALLYEIAPAGSRASSLLRFDLSAWAGQQLQGNAELDMTYLAMYYSNSVDLSIRPVGTAWNEATVTWSNFSNDIGAQVGGGTVSSAGNNFGSHVLFSLPRALVQQWIDTPSSNQGLIVQATGGNTMLFASREYRPTGGQVGDYAPRLSFSAAAPVPEVETWALMAAGLLTLGALVRRRRSA